MNLANPSVDRTRVSRTKRTLSMLAATLGAIACISMSGCSDDDTIRVYSVPKVSQLTEPRETLGAIVPKDTPWAFKLMGKPEKVERYRDDFRQLVTSLSFSEDGTPKWELPAEWREEAGGGFTYRNLHPPSESEVKVTVSQLALPFDPKELDEKKWQGYVADNVNRWRGQLQLSKLSWDELAAELEKIDKLSMPQAPAYFVTLRGQAAGGDAPMGGMGPGMMPPGPAAGAAATPSPSEGSREKREPAFKMPEAWREVPPLSIMAIKSMEVEVDGKKATITFTSAGGDREANVRRWNGQIRGAEEQVSKALDSSIKLTVNGAPTEVVELVGQGDDPQAITAAKVDWSPQDSLFIKLMGPASVVTNQKDAFLEMLKSLTW